MFLSAFLENFLFKKVNSFENRNFQSTIMFFVSSVFLFLIYIIFYEQTSTDLNFLKDWKYYLLIFLEITVFHLYRENYHQNKNNYTMVNMFVFSTIYLMPVLTFLYNSIFIFNTNLDIKYTSIIEAFVFSMVLFVLTTIYYINKIKNKEVKNLKLLLALLFILLNSMYFSVKTIQTYNGFLAYSIIQILIALYFLALSKNESKNITLKSIGVYCLWPFIYVLYLLASSLIAVEFIAIFKRVSQVLSAMILDKKVIFKDAILISLIIFTSILFYIYKIN